MNKEEKWFDKYLSRANQDIQYCEEHNGLKEYVAGLLENNEYLQQRNKRLEEVFETLKETNKLLLQQKGQLQEDLDMLDKRIDKAIEYIKDNTCYDKTFNYCCDDLNYDECNELLKILKGE